ncbi:flavin-containing monooxygenase FMO GS-OX-like 8 [Lolium perenne]|uniref:flavin-containing monooxygenase FMO GS-OX-like 8 n=1 Tax=Lolium perenne TaxID=4522 RepID=UPI0021F54FB6|nr:flavin-containing monooxygenase FMO GS-OX-like 8 [Lolium perenne]
MVCNSKPTQSKKVCIIGAGMAGLAAVYELRQEGHDVTVLEQSGDIGGQWLYDLRSDGADPLGTTTPVRVHISIYASLRLISPRQTTGFTDFQFSPKNGRDNRLYPGHREMHAFGLMEAVAQQGRAGDDALLEQRRLASALRMERRCAQQELRRWGGDYGAGTLNAPSGDH